MHASVLPEQMDTKLPPKSSKESDLVGVLQAPVSHATASDNDGVSFVITIYVDNRLNHSLLKLR